MASIADERVAIEKRLSDNWTTTDIAFDNVPYSPTSANYIALFILPASATQNEIQGTNSQIRYVGVITIQIFTATDIGSATALGYADTLSALFRNAQFNYGTSGTITTRQPQIQRVGVVSGRFQINLSVPYYRDATT